MDLSIIKRQRAVLTTVVLALGLIFLNDLPIHIGYQLIILLAVIGLLTIWFLRFDLKWIEHFRLLTPIFVYAIIAYLRVQTFQPPLLWPVIAGFSIGFYILLLAINIINVSTVRTVPLRKAALSTLFFIGIAIFSIWALLLISGGWGINNNLFYFWGLMTLFGLSFLSLVNNRMAWVEGALFCLVSLKLELLINFWPASWIITAGALVGWNFIFLGIFQHHLEKNLKNSILREYLVIGLLLLAGFLTL